MIFKKKSNNFKQLFYSKGALFVLVLVLAGTIFVFSKAAQRKREVEKEIDALKQEIEKLGRRNGDIAALIENFSDKDYLEQEARLRLNLKRNGEEVAVITPQTGQTSQSGVNSRGNTAGAPLNSDKISEEMKIASPKMNNMKRWLEYFFE